MDVGFEKDPQRFPADAHQFDPARINSEQMSLWCRELNLSPHGTMEERVERIERIIAHFN